MLAAALCTNTLTIAALAFGLFHAARLRSAPLVVAGVLIVYVLVVTVLAQIPPHVEVPGAAFFTEHLLALPGVIAALGATGTWVAFRRAAGEWDGTEAHAHASRAGYAYLGLTLLNVAVVALIGIGAFAATR